LFVGEAPGGTEDLFGKPFIGPAGKLLESIIATTQMNVGLYGYALTNLVACFPAENKETNNHAPPKEAIKQCSDRLREVVAMCRPMVVIQVGRLSEKWSQRLIDNDSIAYRSIAHPAAILRLDVSQRGLAIQRCEVTIETIVREKVFSD
jgi:DNA polymerase